MCWILFICKGPASFIESINQSGSPKKNICWYGIQKLPKNSYKAWKNNYGMQLFKIFPSFWIFGQQYYKNESIHLDSLHHSYKKQIDSLETQVVFVDIFAWTWNIWRSRTENTSKQQKMVAFVRNCLVKITLRLSYSISLIMTIAPMLLRQFRRLAQGHCWSYANSLKQLLLKLHLWKNIFGSFLSAYWRYKPGFCFFPDK